MRGIRRWFSVKVFSMMLVLFSLFSFVMVTHGKGTAKNSAAGLGLLMLLFTGSAACAVFASWVERDWDPEPEPFWKRNSVSGRAWAGALAALLPVNAFLIWFGWF